MIEPRQLRYFIAVTQHLHFGRAADTLNVAQSALSAQIKKLENDLGVRLLNRSKRSAVSLTDAGRMFLTEAQAALRQLERADRVGRLAGRGELGQLDLGYVASAAICGLLTKTLGAYRSTHPSVNVKVLPMDTPSQLRAITDGLIDVGIIRPRPSYPDDVLTKKIHSEPLRLALPTDNPFALHNTIPIEALESQSFVAPQFDEAFGFADYLKQLGEIAGFPIEPAYRVADFVTAISMAAAGYGVVLVPGSFERLRMDGVSFRPIAGYDATVELALAWRRFEPSPSVQNFIATCN